MKKVMCVIFSVMLLFVVSCGSSSVVEGETTSNAKENLKDSSSFIDDTYGSAQVPNDELAAPPETDFIWFPTCYELAEFVAMLNENDEAFEEYMANQDPVNGIRFNAPSFAELELMWKRIANVSVPFTSASMSVNYYHTKGALVMVDQVNGLNVRFNIGLCSTDREEDLSFESSETPVNEIFIGTTQVKMYDLKTSDVARIKGKCEIDGAPVNVTVSDYDGKGTLKDGMFEFDVKTFAEIVKEIEQ